MDEASDRPIFVSYARDDVSRVAKLVDALADEGIAVWWDENLDAGQRWRDVLPEAIDKAAAVLVLWTNRSAVSDYERAEAEQGRQRNMLLPVKFEGGVEVPMPFGEIQNHDLCGWDGERSADFDRLVRTIRVMVERRRRGPYGWDQ